MSRPRRGRGREGRAPAEKPKDLTGRGTVLLVEDEDAVRSFAARALGQRGYRVLEATTGTEALEVFKSHHGDVDLVVSDVVMPEMDGPTLCEQLRRERPDLKVIFISGMPRTPSASTSPRTRTSCSCRSPWS